MKTNLIMKSILVLGIITARLVMKIHIHDQLITKKQMKAQLFVLILLLASCSESQKRVSFSESTTAKSTALTEAFISIPMDIKKRGDILYVGDFKGDSLLFCYNLRKRSFVKQMLPQGQGANEFLSPVEFFISDSFAFIHNRWHFTARNYAFNAKDFSIQPQGELIHLPPTFPYVYLYRAYMRNREK